MILKKYNKQNQTQRGFGLIEVLVASVIISTSLIALASVIQISYRVVGESFNRGKAEFLAEEGLEVVRILRDSSWFDNITTLATSTTHYPLFNSASSTWSLVQSDPGIIDNEYTRIILIENVYRRNSDDDIVSASSTDAKTIDPGTKMITSRVFWGESKELSLMTYMMDIFGN